MNGVERILRDWDCKAATIPIENRISSFKFYLSTDSYLQSKSSGI
jgi:hypothetical protein